MPDRSYWSAFFHRAAKEEIGTTIIFDTELPEGFIQNNLNGARPPEFEDYTVALGSLPNTIFIVKPGVTLD
jgi:hypothetical protein